MKQIKPGRLEYLLSVLIIARPSTLFKEFFFYFSVKYSDVVYFLCLLNFSKFLISLTLNYLLIIAAVYL